MIDLVNVMTYCRDWTEIENYKEAIADKENMWVCHHRWETNDPERPCTKAELIESGHYYNVPAFDLIFLTKSEHAKIHKCGDNFSSYWENGGGFNGKHHSEKTKKKISEKMKGKVPYTNGKHLSEETKKKISEKLKGNKNAKRK